MASISIVITSKLPISYSSSTLPKGRLTSIGCSNGRNSMNRLSPVITRFAAATVLCVALAIPGTSLAVSEKQWGAAQQEVTSAQKIAPNHVQIAIEKIDLSDDGRTGPVPCTLRGNIERVFRGSMVIGQLVAIRDNCIIRSSHLVGGIEYGFYHDKLNEAKHIEAFLNEDGQTIAGHAGWIIEAASEQPRYPAPAGTEGGTPQATGRRAVSRAEALERIHALPEVEAWSAFIAGRDHRRVRPMLMVWPEEKIEIAGQWYWPVNFYADDGARMHRWESFLVGADSDAILIDDFNDGPIDLGRWRREKKPLNRIGKPKGNR